MRKPKKRARQIEPTTMYAMPRNGFLPPSHDVVESTTDLVPENDVTGNSVCPRASTGRHADAGCVCGVSAFAMLAGGAPDVR